MPGSPDKAGTSVVPMPSGQIESPPAQWRQRIDHRDRGHQGSRAFFRSLLDAAVTETDKLLQPDREVGIAEGTPQPGHRRAACQGVHRRLGFDRDRIGEAPQLRHIDPADRQGPLRPPGWPGGDAASARRARIQQQGQGGPVIGVLRQHPARQIGNQGGQVFPRRQSPQSCRAQACAG